MKLLCIQGQDIARITLGRLRDDQLVDVRDWELPPEEYLFALDQTLKDWGETADGWDGVVVVRGPGSFTASRMSTIMANTIGFAKDIPVYGLENTQRLSLTDLLKSFRCSRLQAEPFVLPFYDRPPHITERKSK